MSRHTRLSYIYPVDIEITDARGRRKQTTIYFTSHLEAAIAYFATLDTNFNTLTQEQKDAYLVDYYQRHADRFSMLYLNAESFFREQAVHTEED